MPESTDCLALSIVDKYAFRKGNLHLHDLGADEVYLADFAALFSSTQSKRYKDEDPNEDAVDHAEAEHAEDAEHTAPSGRDFTEKRYSKRMLEKIIRYVHFKLHDDPEAYYCKQILLYCPWSAEGGNPFSLSINEDSYLLDGHSSFEERYLSVKQIIEQNWKRYEFNDWLDWDEVQKTAKELADADEVLFQVGISDLNTKTEEVESEKYDIGQDIGVTLSTTFDYEGGLALPLISNSDYYHEARRLIWDQRAFLYHIMHQFKYGSKGPFYEFLTGGAGTGKTVVVRVIAEAINRMHNHRVGVDPQSMKVLLVAFTGSAAFNVNGTTIHHAFHVPYGRKLLPYRRLSGEQQSRMRDQFMDLLFLIIDEISMTGATLLYYVHRRFQDIFET